MENINLGELNWLAVAVTAVVAYVLGAVYYIALGKPWMSAAKLTNEMVAARKSDNNIAYGTVALASIVGTVILAVLVQATGANDAVEGLILGVIAGLIITAVGQVPNYAFQYRGLKLYLIDAGYPLLQMAIGGAILGYWQ